MPYSPENTNKVLVHRYRLQVSPGILRLMKVSFSKMQGLGNDFVVVDNREAALSLDSQIARTLADRKLGIGCDQLLAIELADAAIADFTMRIFNADGGEVEHCGNGARAVARYCVERGLVNTDEVRLQVKRGTVNAFVTAGGEVRVDMGEPVFEPAKVPFVTEYRRAVYTVDIAGRATEIGIASMGNPHALTTASDIASFDLETLGIAAQTHAAFPEQINFAAAQILDRERITLRVFERGVGETLACGTGACAAVAILVDQGRVGPNVTVSLPGGTLLIEWEGPGSALYMTGPADFVFDGMMELA